MRRLIRAAGRKGILILENLPVRHAKKEKQWLANHEKPIKVF
jgi:hypothetical protein